MGLEMRENGVYKIFLYTAMQSELCNRVNHYRHEICTVPDAMIGRNQ